MATTSTSKTSGETRSTDPSAPTSGVHPTWEEAQAKIEDEIADYRARKADEQAQVEEDRAEAEAASTAQVAAKRQAEAREAGEKS